MKVVEVAVKKVYWFNCPNCQSKLEADSRELEDIGGKVCRFSCPVCRKERYITWSELHKKIVHEGEGVRKNRSSFYERSMIFMIITKRQIREIESLTLEHSDALAEMYCNGIYRSMIALRFVEGLIKSAKSESKNQSS